jgi:phospholipid transport system substrate-binding protein
MTSLKASLIALAALAATAMPAFADAATEKFVQKNASEALATLNDPSLDQAARTQKFEVYMDKFTDLDKVSGRVIGKYRRRFSNDELARYRASFKNYALAVYAAELDAYRGKDVEVITSVDYPSKHTSVVITKINMDSGKSLGVRWRVETHDGDFQVVDAGLDLDGNLIWLAGEQKAQFLSILDRNNGSADALITKIDAMTAELKASQRQ